MELQHCSSLIIRCTTMSHRTPRLLVLEDRLAPAIATWDGGGADSNWMTAANWVGDVAPIRAMIFFSRWCSRLANVNDFAADTAFGQIHISGPGYTLSGNAVNLGGGILVDSTSPTPSTTISLPLALTADQSFSSNFSSPTTFTAGIDLNGFELMLHCEFTSSMTISAAISGSGQLIDSSTGTLNLTGANTYTGTTTSTAEQPVVSNMLPGPVVMNSGSSLSGLGRVGPLTNNGGIIHPGLVSADLSIVQPGTITTSDLVLQGNFADLSLAVTNQGKSKLDVHGTVQVGGSIFVQYQVGQHPIHVGDVFTIIQNDGTDPVGGTFLNSPEGAIVQQGAIPLRISYHGGDGNDVTLTAVSQTTFAVAAGAGGAPIVNVYNPDGGLVRSFMAYDAAFRGGVHVTVADVTGDFVPDVITAPGTGGGPIVRIWEARRGRWSGSSRLTIRISAAASGWRRPAS